MTMYRDNASADNALATATIAADARKTYRIRKVSASYNAAVIGVLQIKFDTTVVWEQAVHNQRDLSFEPRELVAGQGEAVSAELAASGSAGQIGYVSIQAEDGT